MSVEIPARRLDPKIAGLLAYVIGPFVLLLQRNHPTVRFHAMQASLLAISLAVINLSLYIVLAAIYWRSWYAGVAAQKYIYWFYYGEVVLWIVMLWQGYDLVKVRLPWIGAVAEQLAGERD
ncbi:MAG TPA: hypothetical protein PLP42_17435 [Acidobacteriota bacterium]|nr:hypothetical protein [Acidobacteriota bacterium]